MTCEGKDLNMMPQDELSQAYKFHVWYLGHGRVDANISDGQVGDIRRQVQHKIHETQDAYIGRFGKDAFAELATDVIMEFRREILENG